MIVEKRTVESTLTASLALALGLSLPASAQVIGRAAPASTIGIAASVSGASYTSALPISLGTSLNAPSIGALPSIAPAISVNAAPALAAAAAAVPAAASAPEAAPDAAAAASASAPAERSSAATAERQLSERIIGAHEGAGAQQALEQSFDGRDNAARVAQLVSHVFSVQNAYAEKADSLRHVSSYLSHYALPGDGTSPLQPKVNHLSEIASQAHNIGSELAEHMKLFNSPLIQSEEGIETIWKGLGYSFGPSAAAIIEKYGPDLNRIKGLSAAIIQHAETRLVQLERNMRAELSEGNTLLNEIHAGAGKAVWSDSGNWVAKKRIVERRYFFGLIPVRTTVTDSVWVPNPHWIALDKGVMGQLENAIQVPLPAPILVH